MTDRNEKKTFVLHEGTPDHIEFTWPVGAFPPGAWGTKVYEALLRLRDAATRSSPQTVPMLDGVMLGWIYTAIESERVRAHNEQIEQRLRKLEHDFNNLKALVHARTGDRP